MGLRLIPISTEPEEIVKVAPDGTERKFLAWPTLSAEEALLIFRDDQMEQEERLEMYAAILSRCLVDKQPEMTKEQVLKTFDPAEIYQVIGHFLTLTGRNRSLPVSLAATPTSTTKEPLSVG